MTAPTALDLFAGAGGTTQGLREAGFVVLLAIENDPVAAESFAANHPSTEILVRDIQRVQAPALARRLERPVDLLTACPPCQPYSTLGSGLANDARNALISSLARFVHNIRPRMLMLENVPGVAREPRLRRLMKCLEPEYELRQYIVQAAEFGVPQNRRRMIVLGARKDLAVTLPEEIVDALSPDIDIAPRTARSTLARAAKIKPEADPIHRARRSAPLTLARIREVGQGGGRAQLPEQLVLKCHAKLERRDATSIYGRIDPDKPAPTMTTRCTTPSCGRFVHPTEDRGLTLREAAMLQTFPIDYAFRGGYDRMERQIGNALPPKLAKALGLVAMNLLTGADGVQSRDDRDAVRPASDDALAVRM